MTHAWMPTSPCGPACFSGDEPTVGRFRAALRLLHAAGVVLAALAVSVVMPVLGRRRRALLVRWFFRSVLRAFNVRLAVFNAGGLESPGGALVVNNHISWLDIVAVNAVRPMRAQAKIEVRSWPVLGRLATVAGTVYVDRERLRLLPAAMAELASVMRAGSQVNVTPEARAGVAAPPVASAPRRSRPRWTAVSR